MKIDKIRKIAKRFCDPENGYYVFMEEDLEDFIIEICNDLESENILLKSVMRQMIEDINNDLH